MSIQPVLINGQWTTSTATRSFHAVDPQTRQPLPAEYPVSPWEEVERAIAAAADVARQTRDWSGERFAGFLQKYADAIEARSSDLVETAHRETALAKQPRLKDVELPRTTNQLRQAAAAAREGSWAQPTIDSKSNIRSMYAPIGPVAVFGPNNFPFAFNSMAGGDFAAAIAAGNPVIAKGHSSHPGTTRIFAEAAIRAVEEADMPASLVQLIYRTSHEDGKRLVSHPLLGATGYTGSRRSGLQLKCAAEAAGNPVYLELSSINPVFVLPGALDERLEGIADEFSTSCLMGTGQFCTNPGLVVLVTGVTAEEFIAAVAERFERATSGTMLGEGVLAGFQESLAVLRGAGAQTLTGGEPGGGQGYCYRNTLLRVDGTTFLDNAETLQTEAFGNGSLFVVADDAEQIAEIAKRVEGNLTGCIYSDTTGADDALYDQLAPILRRRVGRLLNDKMPTGVAVSPAMNHGGPYPATGHPGYTSVGIPASIHRFAMLQCYDNVRPERLPLPLRDNSPNRQMWRFIDGAWTRGDVQ